MDFDIFNFTFFILWCNYNCVMAHLIERLLDRSVVVYLTSSCVNWTFFGMSGSV
jgi:hypothetical protein